MYNNKIYFAHSSRLHTQDGGSHMAPSMQRGLSRTTNPTLNVVPRSTGNTNNGTRELTMKCKLKCYFKPMNNPLGVSPSKGKQGTT